MLVCIADQSACTAVLHAAGTKRWGYACSNGEFSVVYIVAEPINVVTQYYLHICSLPCMPVTQALKAIAYVLVQEAGGLSYTEMCKQHNADPDPAVLTVNLMFLIDNSVHTADDMHLYTDIKEIAASMQKFHKTACSWASFASNAPKKFI